MLPVLLKNNYFQRNTKQILSSNIKLIYYFCCIDLMRSIIAAFSCCTSKNLGYWFWVSILISSCFTQTPVVIHNLSLSDVSLRYETKSVELLRTLLFPLFSYHSYLGLFFSFLFKSFRFFDSTNASNTFSRFFYVVFSVVFFVGFFSAVLHLFLWIFQSNLAMLLPFHLVQEKQVMLQLLSNMAFFHDCHGNSSKISYCSIQNIFCVL